MDAINFIPSHHSCLWHQVATIGPKPFRGTHQLPPLERSRGGSSALAALVEGPEGCVPEGSGCWKAALGEGNVWNKNEVNVQKWGEGRNCLPHSWDYRAYFGNHVISSK